MSRLLYKKCPAKCSVLISGPLLKTNQLKSVRNFSIDFQSYVYGLRKVSLSIANSEIVSSTKENFISIHEWLPISWTLEIGLITAGVRALVTFPLTIIQRRVLFKYESLQPEINEYSKKLLKDVKTTQYLMSLSPLKAKLLHNRLLKKEMRRLIIRDNCHPMKASLVLWFQMPVWVIISHTIRNMSYMYPTVDHNSQTIYTQLSNEGLLWFTNLTQPDPYWILPILTAIINLTIVQLHSNERLISGRKTKWHSIITNFGRILCVILIPIGIQMPSAVSFYWLISSSMGLIQNLIFRNKKFKQIISIDKQSIK